MLLRRLRCDELGVCQARSAFCSGCFDKKPGNISKPAKPKTPQKKVLTPVEKV